ncbi:MAG: hypothetical protein ABFE13_11920 [Phycisphaerales bacterium]
MTLDREQFNPQPDPDSWYLEVEPNRDWAHFHPKTVKQAESEAEIMAANVRRHVDDVGYISTHFATWKCPVCGYERDSYREALECCGVKCPDCGGTERLPLVKGDDDVWYAPACKTCRDGFVPDSDEWAARHPDEATP